MEMASSSRGKKRASKQAVANGIGKAQNSDKDTRDFVKLISQSVQSIMLHSTNEDFRRTNFSKLKVTNVEDAEIVFRNKFLELCGLEPDPFPNDFNYSEDTMEQITPQQVLQSSNSESVTIHSNSIPTNSESVTIHSNSIPTNSESVTIHNNIPTNSESVTIHNNIPTNSESVTIIKNIPENSESVTIYNNIPTNSESVTIINNIPENSESHLFVVPVPLEVDNLADITTEDELPRSEPTSPRSSHFHQPSMKRCFDDDNSFVAAKFTKGDMKNILKNKILSLKSLVDTSTINITLKEGGQQNEWRS